MQTRRMHKCIELSIHTAYKEHTVEITNGETIPTKKKQLKDETCFFRGSLSAF